MSHARHEKEVNFMTIYIASSWRNQHAVEMLTALLRERGHTVEPSPAGRCGSLPETAASPLSAGEVKSLHDALITARLALRVLVPKLIAGETVSPSILRSLEEQYCGPECPVDSLEVVTRSRKQFDDVAIEAAALRRETERLRNHLRVARQERDELIKAHSLR